MWHKQGLVVNFAHDQINNFYDEKRYLSGVLSVPLWYDSTNCAPQCKFNSFVTIATYWVPVLPNIKSFSGHLWHSILIFANTYKFTFVVVRKSDLNKFDLSLIYFFNPVFFIPVHFSTTWMLQLLRNLVTFQLIGRLSTGNE